MDGVLSSMECCTTHCNTVRDQKQRSVYLSLLLVIFLLTVSTRNLRCGRLKRQGESSSSESAPSQSGIFVPIDPHPHPPSPPHLFHRTPKKTACSSQILPLLTITLLIRFFASSSFFLDFNAHCFVRPIHPNLLERRLTFICLLQQIDSTSCAFISLLIHHVLRH
jgi:hypothetical protein